MQLAIAININKSIIKGLENINQHWENKMPNNNDRNRNNGFDLVEFCESQLRNTQDIETTIQGVIENDQLDYITLFGLLEKIVTENCIKYQGTNQSQDLMLHIMMILKPIKDKLLITQENTNNDIIVEGEE